MPRGEVGFALHIERLRQFFIKSALINRPDILVKIKIEFGVHLDFWQKIHTGTHSDIRSIPVVPTPAPTAT